MSQTLCFGTYNSCVDVKTRCSCSVNKTSLLNRCLMFSRRKTTRSSPQMCMLVLVFLFDCKRMHYCEKLFFVAGQKGDKNCMSFIHFLLKIYRRSGNEFYFLTSTSSLWKSGRKGTASSQIEMSIKMCFMNSLLLAIIL